MRLWSRCTEELSGSAHALRLTGLSQSQISQPGDIPMIRPITHPLLLAALVTTLGGVSPVAHASDADRRPEVASNTPSTGCANLPSHAALQSALAYARAQANGGFNLDMWGAVVN